MDDLKRLEAISIPPDLSLSKAIEAITTGACQIALVVDQEHRLIGTLTDGDVRRALLSGLNLNSSVGQAMKKDFRSLPEDADSASVLRMMRQLGIHQIPGLDSAGRVTRLFRLEEALAPRKHDNQVVIMAGGRGSRLRSLTDNCPKPMLPVGGKPMLEIIVEQCIDAGFSRFFLAVNYLKKNIMEHFGDGSRWSIKIQYLEEESPLGTAGALSLLPEAPTQPFLVLNGDVLTRVDFGKLLSFHSEQNPAATLCVREYSTQIPFGVAHLDGSDVKLLEEKPSLLHYVNAGIYVLNPQVLDLLSPGKVCDMTELLGSVLHAGNRLAAFPVHEYWLDVGHPETFEQAGRDW